MDPNPLSQLGHDDTASVALPKHIQALEGTKVVDASCGGGHALVLTDEGTLLAFGRGRNGQLGRADRLESVASYRSTPQRVHVRRCSAVLECSRRGLINASPCRCAACACLQFFDGRSIRSFACGSDHSLAIVDVDPSA